MRITNLKIDNFRGIKHADIAFPLNSRIICLIGSGDSGKSTILKSIEWVLWPTWNLTVVDTDFYNSETAEPISISVSISELPEQFIKEDKFGLYLRDYDKAMTDEDDEPTDDGVVVLTIRLTIDSSLEPKWEVITNRTEPKVINQKDRKALSFGVVGFDQEKDFQWGRNSVLQKYADSKDALHNAFMEAMRVAVENTKLESLDQIATAVTETGNQYGVTFKGEVHNRLLMQNGSYSTTVGVFEDKIPFGQRGLGSKRLLSIGMNINAYDTGTLVIIDEVETGLEPFRISSLINQFRTQFNEAGQLFMTTHSVSVLCECTVDEVAICSNREGQLSVHYFGYDKQISDDIQALLRGFPEAFLCNRVIVCEGKTEVGVLRALDKYRIKNGQPRLAYYGVGMVPGGGGNRFFQLAKMLYGCGYDVCILMDSDVSTEESEKEEVRLLGIPVFDWEEGYAIEEQLFKDVSLDCIDAMLEIAIEEKSFEHVRSKLSGVFPGSNSPIDIKGETITVVEDISEKERIAIGTVAKQKRAEWFKSTSKGEMLGEVVFGEFATMKPCHFKKQICALQDWVTHNEKR